MTEPLVDLKQATDEELMLAYQDGREEAFQLLYQRHNRKIYGFLFGKLRNTQLVDEAFQMTFLKLHQARHHYDSSLPFSPWLFTLCRNAMIDLLRSQNRTNRKEELNPIAIENAVAEPSKEVSFIPGLESLPDKHREAVELRYLEELPFEEIAKRLEISPLNARQVVSRAVRSLKKWIGTQKRGDS